MTYAEGRQWRKVEIANNTMTQYIVKNFRRLEHNQQDFLEGRKSQRQCCIRGVFAMKQMKGKFLPKHSLPESVSKHESSTKYWMERKMKSISV